MLFIFVFITIQLFGGPLLSVSLMSSFIDVKHNTQLVFTVLYAICIYYMMCNCLEDAHMSGPINKLDLI